MKPEEGTTEPGKTGLAAESGSATDDRIDREKKPDRLLRLRLTPTRVGPEEGWRDWFKGTYAMLWYLIGVLAACLFAIIELKDRGGWPYTGIVAVIVIVGWAVLGILALWPREDEG